MYPSDPAPTCPPTPLPTCTSSPLSITRNNSNVSTHTHTRSSSLDSNRRGRTLRRTQQDDNSDTECYPFPSTDHDRPTRSPYTSHFNSCAATAVHVSTSGDCHGVVECATSGCSRVEEVEVKEERDNTNSKETSNAPTTASRCHSDTEHHSRTCFHWPRKRRSHSQAEARLDPANVSKSPSNPLVKLVSSISLKLENNGSVARDHLASERTFLAYVRTSLGCATMGVALVQLFALTPETPRTPSLHRVGTILGATTVIVGIIVLLIGITRYFRTQTALVSGSFRPAGAVVYLIVATLALLVVAIFGVLVGIA